MIPAASPLSAPDSPRLTVTVLGSGTSTGVPMIGCTCAVCRSPNPRDKRMRPSILVTVHPDTPTAAPANLLIDVTPEMRIQALRAGVNRIEAVLLTHHHADHILGMDDIRQFNYLQGASIPVYGDAGTLENVRRVFDYAFRETPTAGGKPKMDLIEVQPGVPFEAAGVTVLPMTVLHGTHPILAYRFGSRFAYVTDVSRVPGETREALRGLDALMLGAIRHEPHPTHFSVGEALEHIADLAPRRAWLTHLSHYLEHDPEDAALPDGVHLGYDGLTFEVPADGGAGA